MKYSAILSILLVLIVSMFFSCERNPADGNPPKNEITIDLPFQLAIPAHIKDQVQFAKASVSAEDMDTIWTDLTVTEEYVEGVIKNVPAGEDRHFEISVYDPDSTLTYYGDAYADIQPGKTITLEIVLKPMTTTGIVIIIGYFGEVEGEYIYTWNFGDSDHNIYRYNMQTSLLEKLTSGTEFRFPVFMPRYHKIGHIDWSTQEFWLMDPDGGNPQFRFHLMHQWQKPHYCDMTRKFYYYIFDQGYRRLVTADDRGGSIEYLTEPTFYNNAVPKINLNGDSLLFQSDRSGVYNIFLMELNTREQIQLTFNSIPSIYPKWSKTSNGFFYELRCETSISINYYDLNIKQEKNILSLTTPYIYDYDFSPDESMIALTCSENDTPYMAWI